MVSPAQLRLWKPESLTDISDTLAGHRQSLTQVDADLDTSAPPASWTTGEAAGAATTHGALVTRITTQVSEITGVIQALDAAAVAVTAAQDKLRGATFLAMSYGFTISSETGAVTTSATFEDDDERDSAQLLMDAVAKDVSEALTAATAADTDLVSALNIALNSDINSVGSLEIQGLIADFALMTPREQADFLFEHPEHAATLLPFATEEAKEQLGARIGEQVDGLGKDWSTATDPAAVASMTAILDAYGEDPAVMEALYETVGADGLMAAYANITAGMGYGSDPDGLQALAESLRLGLGTASQSPSFDPSFGQDLVRYGTYDLTEDERDAFGDAYPALASGANASILAYLFTVRDGEESVFSSDLISSAAEQLDTFERSDGFLPATAWYGHNGHSPLNLAFATADPMAAIMGQLGEHPGAGLDFFTADPARQDFYFAERDWRNDGYEGVSRAAAGIGTDPANLQDHPHETAELVSRFSDRITDNEHFTPDNAEAASPHIGDLLRFYTPAVDQNLIGGEAAGDPGVTFYDNPLYGSMDPYPVLFREDVDELMQVGMSTTEGMTSIAEGVGTYQQVQLNNAAHQLEVAQTSGDPTAIDAARGQLRDIVQRSASLTGYAENQAATVEIDGARSQDQQVKFFTDVVSTAAGLVPLPGSDVVGDFAADLISTGWSEAWEVGTDSMNDAWGANEAAATQSAETRASDAVGSVKIQTFLALVEAGVVDVPSGQEHLWIGDDGQVIGLADIPDGQQSSYAQSAMFAVTEGTGISNTDLDVAYKDEFIEFHE